MPKTEKYNKLTEWFPDAILACMFLDYFDKKVQNVIMNLRPDYFQKRATDMPVPVAKLTSFHRVNRVISWTF